MDKEKGRNAARPPPPSPPLRETGQTSSEGQNPCAGGWGLPRGAWLAHPAGRGLLFDLGQRSPNSCKPRGDMYNIP